MRAGLPYGLGVSLVAYMPNPPAVVLNAMLVASRSVSNGLQYPFTGLCAKQATRCRPLVGRQNAPYAKLRLAYSRYRDRNTC